MGHTGEHKGGMTWARFLPHYYRTHHSPVLAVKKNCDNAGNGQKWVAMGRNEIRGNEGKWRGNGGNHDICPFQPYPHPYFYNYPQHFLGTRPNT